MARNCWKMASGQTGSRLVGSCGFGVERSRTAIKLAKSAAFVGAGKSQETSSAESGAVSWIRETASVGAADCLSVQAAAVREIPSSANLRRWKVEVRKGYILSSCGRDQRYAMDSMLFVPFFGRRGISESFEIFDQRTTLVGC